MSERKIRGEWIIVWLIASACLLTIGWYVGKIRTTLDFKKMQEARAAAEVAAATAATKVVVKPVAEEVVNPPRDFVGHVEAQESVEVKARVSGYLTDVKFLEGDVVKAGDLLFTIDDEDYKARIAQRAAEIARAEAALERAESTLKRLGAADVRSVSLIEMDNARTEVAATKAAILGAKANLQLAEIDLKHTKVYAPITGKIGKRLVSKGDYIVPAASLVRVVQLDPIRIIFSVTDRDFIEFKTHADMRGDSDKIRARIMLPNGQEYPHPAQWDFFDNSMSAKAAALTVWMTVENKEGILLPNTYVTVFINGTTVTPTPVVDLAAVTRNVQGAYVYTVNASNVVEMTRVKLGQSTGKIVAVESGLNLGDRVIVEGIQNVRAGSTVEVLNK